MGADGYVLVMPDGYDDGFLWGRDGRDLAAAQRIFAKPRRWPSLEREGWRVVEVNAGEFRARMAAAYEAHTGKRLEP